MRYFIDTEFMEDGVVIELVSIAVVNETGRVFYRVNKDMDPTHANDFVTKNVFPYLVDENGKPRDPECWKSKKEIKNDLLDFIGEELKPEFWAWYGAYDWVCVAQLFGTMMDLPKHFPMWFHELKQLAEEQGNPVKPPQKNVHDPRADAKWVKDYYEKLRNHERGRVSQLAEETDLNPVK